MSLARKIKRGKMKIVYLSSICAFLKYRLTSRGRWGLEGNKSAPLLSKDEMNYLIQQQ